MGTRHYQIPNFLASQIRESLCGSSSWSRAAVSKTVCAGFESLVPRQFEAPPGEQSAPRRTALVRTDLRTFSAHGVVTREGFINPLAPDGCS